LFSTVAARANYKISSSLGYFLNGRRNKTRDRVRNSARPLHRHRRVFQDADGRSTGSARKEHCSDAIRKEAERLDPRNAYMLGQHAQSYLALRRFPEALRKLDQVLNITPDNVDTLVNKAGIAQAEGNLPRAAAILAPLHPNADDTTALEIQVYQAILERRTASIIPRLMELLAKPDPALGYLNGELRFFLGWAQEVGGDHAAAQESWRQARSELEPFLKEQPENSSLIGDLVLTDTGLGDKATALALSERAIAAIPIEKDAIFGPIPIEILARVAARMGDPRPRHCRVTETTLDPVRWRSSLRRAAYACSAPARSNVRSAPE
jgi:tetratricopeptide (TPR) repeat protein